MAVIGYLLRYPGKNSNCSTLPHQHQDTVLGLMLPYSDPKKGLCMLCNSTLGPRQGPCKADQHRILALLLEGHSNSTPLPQFMEQVGLSSPNKHSVGLAV